MGNRDHHPDLTLYAALSRLPWPKSYYFKILALCFVGTHIPLIATAVLALALLPIPMNIELALVGLLLATTAAAATATILLVRGMLSPIAAVTRALDAYRQDGSYTPIPAVGDDEAGMLISTVNTIVREFTETRSELEALSYRDDLIGIGNRRWLLGKANELLRSDDANARPTTVALLDLDSFKVINDTCGHAAGDDVLKQVGAVLTAHSRPRDLVGRLGGDEFCVIFLDCPREEAAAAVDRMRTALKQKRLDERYGIDVSISCGLTERHDPHEDLDETFARADKALYRAKEAGRGQTELSEPKMSP